MPTAYADWKAPQQDAADLIWPEPSALLAQTRENQFALSSTHAVRIQNVPLTELRTAARRFVGHTDDARPLIATGHQAELWHAGVWAKNALIHAIAEKAGGLAYHISLDTDQPKHMALRWPGGAAPITDDPRLVTADWTGLIDPPTPAHLALIEQQFTEAAQAWDFTPAASVVFDELRRNTLDPKPLPAALLQGFHALDWSLGLRYSALTLSPVLSSDSYLAFVHHIAARAGEFGAGYNAAIADYRAEQKIVSTTRPVNDLALAADACELPFWLDNLATGDRSSPTLHRVECGWTLRSGGDRYVFDPAADAYHAAATLRNFLRLHRLRIGPRALTLTMFLRLVLADQFVHGIGGGRYDQITDRLIRTHFGIEPPAFSVTTATLFFPTATRGERVCLPCLLTEGHRLSHNFIGAEKRPLLAAVDSAPRKSAERRASYLALHRALADAARASDALSDWRQRLAAGRRRAQEEKVLYDRELFYAVQPIERLRAVVENYRAALA